MSNHRTPELASSDECWSKVRRLNCKQLKRTSRYDRFTNPSFQQGLDHLFSEYDRLTVFDDWVTRSAPQLDKSKI